MAIKCYIPGTLRGSFEGGLDPAFFRAELLSFLDERMSRSSCFRPFVVLQQPRDIGLLTTFVEPVYAETALFIRPNLSQLTLSRKGKKKC